jgi:hypothetical protein
MVSHRLPESSRLARSGRGSVAVVALGLLVLIASAASTTGRPATAVAGGGPSRAPSTRLLRAERTISDVAGEPIPFGTAHYLGAPAASRLRDQIVAMAAAPGGGYWLAGNRGAVWNYGQAQYWGSATDKHLHDDIVAMAATPTGLGYYLAASDGAVYPCGDARGHGSAFGKHPRVYIVAMAVTPTGGGYWLLASDGAVYRFGDAHWYGAPTGKHPRVDMVAIATTTDGKGYWIAAADGSVYAYGDARGHGSAFGKHPRVYIVAMAATPTGDGYWLFAANGAVYRFAGAHWYGSAAVPDLKNPIIGAAAAPGGHGYWLLPAMPPRPAPGPGFLAGHVTAIGDSVMLDVQPCLEADIPGIDVEAMVSRQWEQGVVLAEQLKSQDKLGATVVIDLGTNGPVTPQMFTQMMDVLAGASRVVFVTIHLPPSYSWWQSVNETLEQGVPRYAIDRLADFNKLADENPQWFGPDGVHMPIGGAGAQAMAELIKSEI